MDDGAGARSWPLLSSGLGSALGPGARLVQAQDGAQDGGVIGPVLSGAHPAHAWGDVRMRAGERACGVRIVLTSWGVAPPPCIPPGPLFCAGRLTATARGPGGWRCEPSPPAGPWPPETGPGTRPAAGWPPRPPGEGERGEQRWVGSGARGGAHISASQPLQAATRQALTSTAAPVGWGSADAPRLVLSVAAAAAASGPAGTASACRLAAYGWTFSATAAMRAL